MFWSVYLLPSFLPCISLPIPTICLYICSRIFATNWDLLSELAVSLHFCNFVLFSSLRESCIFAGCAIVEKGSMYTGELMTFPAILQIWSGSHPCCNICSSERSGHPRREACARAGHCVPVTGFMVLTGFGNREKVLNLVWGIQGLEKCLNFIHGLKKSWKKSWK